MQHCKVNLLFYSLKVIITSQRRPLLLETAQNLRCGGSSGIELCLLFPTNYELDWFSIIYSRLSVESSYIGKIMLQIMVSISTPHPDPTLTVLNYLVNANGKLDSKFTSASLDECPDKFEQSSTAPTSCKPTLY
jgi:hypothetical protein